MQSSYHQSTERYIGGWALNVPKTRFPAPQRRYEGENASGAPTGQMWWGSSLNAVFEREIGVVFNDRRALTGRRLTNSETFSGHIKQHKTRCREGLHVVPAGFRFLCVVRSIAAQSGASPRKLRLRPSAPKNSPAVALNHELRLRPRTQVDGLLIRSIVSELQRCEPVTRVVKSREGVCAYSHST